MNWLRLHHSVLTNPKVQQLSDHDFKCWINLLIIASMREPRGTLPPVKELGYMLRCYGQHASKLVRRLIEVGLIFEQCNGFELNDWEEHQPESDDVNKRVKKHRDAKRNVTGNVTVTAQIREEQIREEQITPIVPLTGDVEVEVSLVPKVAQEFEKDWRHFWVKVGKGSARKAYLNARKKISREELITAVKGHGPQILSRAQSQGITPIHPATWLNQERWTDEAQALVVSARASPLSRKEQARIDFEKRLLEEMNERGYVLGSGS